MLGIDTSPLVVAEATRRSQGRNLPVDFRVGDAFALDLPDGAFDRCRAERLLMHAHGEPAAIVAELTRVLRPSGRLVAFELDWDTLAIDGAEQELTRRIVRSYSDGVANGCVGRTLPRLLRDAGLIDVVTIPHAIEIPFDFFGWVLSGHLDAAIAAGSFTPEELIGWWDAIDAAHARGRFFAAILGFVVAGSKPACGAPAPRSAGERGARPAGLLRLVERGVGRLEQVRQLAAVVAAERRADRDGDGRQLAVARQARADLLDDRGSGLLRRGRVAGEPDRELVAAERPASPWRRARARSPSARGRR